MARFISGWRAQGAQLYANLKIKQKLLLYSLGLLAVLCSIFALFYGKLAGEMILDRADETTTGNMESIALFFADVNHDVSVRLSHLNSSISVRNALLVAARGGDVSQWPVHALLYDIENSNYINSVYLYTLNGVLIDSVGDDDAGDLPADTQAFTRVLEDGIASYWCDESAFSNSRGDGVFVYQAIVDVSGSPIGMVRVGISNGILAEMYSYVGLNMTSQLYVFSNQGNLLLPVDADPIYLIVGRESFAQFLADENQSIDTITYQKAQYRVYNQPFPAYGLYVVGIVPHDLLMEDIYTQQMLIGGLATICILLQILGLLFLAHTFSAPLQGLSAHMRLVSDGDLSLRINNQNKDEIGQLSRSYDKMLDQIQCLMQEVSAVEKQRYKLELISLQTQITPHFLYNSLENLSALAQMGEMEGAYQMAKSLGLFYRGVLSDGHSIVRMDEEVAIIEHYLQVQTQRYPDSFDYSIDLDPALANMSMVKLTLQPLVENAINHGLRNVRHRGLLTLSIAAQGELVVIRVKDNGKGMETVPDCTANETGGGHFSLRRGGYGMGNVDRRLKLYYGEGYGLRIDSALGKGTEILIRIPKIPYQEEGYDIRFNRG